VTEKAEEIRGKKCDAGNLFKSRKEWKCPELSLKDSIKTIHLEMSVHIFTLQITPLLEKN